jgi:hypothetical protein
MKKKTSDLPVDYATVIKVSKLKDKILKAIEMSNYLISDSKNGRAILFGSIMVHILQELLLAVVPQLSPCNSIILML